MQPFYRKSPLGFALLWIGVYTLGMSAFESLSRSIGIESFAAALFALFLSLFLFLWLKQAHLTKLFGLCKPHTPAKAFFWYIPLLVLTSCNLWHGIAANYSPVGTVFFILKMLCVGFLEELIFRGFLFRALEKDSLKSAVLVSSLTFGVGHILNLFNGSGMALGDNLFQIVSAITIGYLYVVLFLRSGSLWLCILSHGILNSLSAFSNDTAPWQNVLIGRIVLCLLVAGYALFLSYCLYKNKKEAI